MRVRHDMKTEAENEKISTDVNWKKRYKDLREEYIWLWEIYQNLVKKFQVKMRVDND